MKILLTGGGTGGHFYPLIAVAEALQEKARERKFLDPALYFMSNTPYNPSVLFDHDITYLKASAGKFRRDLTILNLILNFIDIFKVLWGSFKAVLSVFFVYPDVVFGKGGYTSFPALLAARILRIPVVIHESDSHPGKVISWAGKFAQVIAVSYPQAAEFFPKAKEAGKVVWTGNPIRKEIITPITNGAHEFLGTDPNIPVLFVLCGSLGSQAVNEAVLQALPELVKNFQIIHATGKTNFEMTKGQASVILENNPLANRYKPFDYLNALSMRMAGGVASIIISRAGSTIFEIAAWKVPAILIPIPERTSHDQHTNAYTYARAGGAVVIEQDNLTPDILVSQCNLIINNPEKQRAMKEAAAHFSRTDAAEKIADVILDIAAKHE